MYELNFKKRSWIVKQRLSGVSTSKVALSLSYRTPKQVWGELVSGCEPVSG